MQAVKRQKFLDELLGEEGPLNSNVLRDRHEGVSECEGEEIDSEDDEGKF
jgi:hypothetical protein